MILQRLLAEQMKIICEIFKRLSDMFTGKSHPLVGEVLEKLRNGSREVNMPKTFRTRSTRMKGKALSSEILKALSISRPTLIKAWKKGLLVDGDRPLLHRDPISRFVYCHCGDLGKLKKIFELE